MPSKKKTPGRRRAAAADLEREADRLLTLAADPQLIAGIHNYCDRWCERCPLTRRCLVFKSEADCGRRAPLDDDRHQAFWDEVAESFEVAMKLVEREAKKHGVDWYMFFIEVKLQRAIASRVDAAADGGEARFPSDADGSAKVALIGIDRSIWAGAELRGHCPNQADPILNLLVQLEQLRRLTETEFPRARDFKRPGFDA